MLCVCMCVCPDKKINYLILLSLVGSSHSTCFQVEQLHRIFRLCGTPSEEYWKRLKLSTTFRPPRSYKPSLQEAFKGFPISSLGLLSTLLALDPVVALHLRLSETK